MRPSEALTLHREQIREIALRHRVTGVRVFGSALHGDDTVDSDLDLLVEPTAQTTLMDIGAIRFELKQLLGIDVDVLTPHWLACPLSRHLLPRSPPPMTVNRVPKNTVQTGLPALKSQLHSWPST